MLAKAPVLSVRSGCGGDLYFKKRFRTIRGNLLGVEWTACWELPLSRLIAITIGIFLTIPIGIACAKLDF